MRKRLCVRGEKYKPWEQRVPLSSATNVAINQFCGAIFSTAIKSVEGAGDVLASNPPSGSLLQLTTRTPAFPNKLSQGRRSILSFLPAWQVRALQRTTSPAYPHLETLPSIFSSSVLYGWARRAIFRPLLPRIQHVCILPNTQYARMPSEYWPR